MIVPLPDDPHLKAKEQLHRDMVEERSARAEEAYRQAIEDQYYTLYRYPPDPLPDDAQQVWFLPAGAPEWEPLGYATDPVIGIDYGAPAPAESAAFTWPHQYGKTAALGTVTVEAPLTGDTGALFDVLLAGHRARLDRRIRRLADDLGLWEGAARAQFDAVERVLERAGIGDGYGRLTIPQPARPPIEPPQRGVGHA